MTESKKDASAEYVKQGMSLTHLAQQISKPSDTSSSSVSSTAPESAAGANSSTVQGTADEK